MRRIAFLLIGCMIATIATACDARRDADGVIETSGDLDAFQMQVGDCFDDVLGPAAEISEVPGVPCASLHDNEVYAVFDVAEAVWPGDVRITELADIGCLERFEAAIGAPYQESELVFTTLTPSATSWSEVDDREVVCIAYHMELEKLSGSVLGSGR